MSVVRAPFVGLLMLTFIVEMSKGQFFGPPVAFQNSFGQTYGREYSREFGSNFGTSSGIIGKRSVPEEAVEIDLPEAIKAAEKDMGRPCMQVMVCKIGAKDSDFGFFGGAVVDYFRDSENTIPVLDEMAPVYRLGQLLSDTALCRPRLSSTCALPDSHFNDFSSKMSQQ